MGVLDDKMAEVDAAIRDELERQARLVLEESNRSFLENALLAHAREVENGVAVAVSATTRAGRDTAAERGRRRNR